MDVSSIAVGFLAGAATTYLASYFLKSKTAATATTQTAFASSVNLPDQLWQAHEKLLTEMKQDLDNPEFQFHREFYVMKKGWGWSRWGFHRKGPCLAYFLDDHDNLLQQLDTLAAHGLISNQGETDKNTIKFRLNDKFVELLRGRKD
ncbi:hypothetical protein [Nitrosomonas sp. ANs5]|uniref:hypothetical protein n=1 Tax=Nitrosomonas sp. ANs5 TaxID=3423941 RepID=UPI003D326198